MNDIWKRNGQSMQKPGCLGKMVNLFDLSNGAAGNRLLTDKTHRNGFSLSRSQSDMARMSSAPFGVQIEDKMIVSELKRSSSNKKGRGTPMKTLIAQEMSKEVEPKHNPPNLVAKLMGLDALPHQQSNSTAQRSFSKGYSRHSLSHSGMLVENWEEDHSFIDNKMQYEGPRYQEHNENKDVHQIWRHSEKKNVRDSSPRKGRCNERANEKRKAFVLQKFMEAKRLATDEKGCRSKEFIDAVEVLSSNRDLFLKFLQESNSTCSHHLCGMQSTITPPPETKCITVLRPSKIFDSEKVLVSGKNIEKQTDKATLIDQDTGWDRNIPGCSPTFSNKRVDGYPSQPTRIVVLKPTPGKTHDINATVSPSPSPSRVVRDKELFDESEGDEAQESGDLAKEITRQMHENLMGHRRDETLLSSVFSNGYIGDNSSFVKSEIEYIAGNLSDSETISPASRHSWDYINKFGSPYSNSSFSRASCSAESSVCREAKKRLSERWAMMASNASSQEHRDSRRSSSTLGEMLALSDTKKSKRSVGQSSRQEQESKPSTFCLASNVDKEEDLASSPKGLLRSKSLPASSTVYETGITAQVADPEVGKQEVSKKLTKAKGSKSSFRGKFSSLFLSRSKKLSKERSDVYQSKYKLQSSSPETAGSPAIHADKISDDASICVSNSGFEDCLSAGSHGSSNKTTIPEQTSTGTRQTVITHEASLSVAKPVMPGNMIESQDQPSPISVLEPPFEEDDSYIPDPSGNNKPDFWGSEMALKSNLIGKSPPIGSIARTLSWDDSCVETSSQPSKPSPTSSGADEDEPDWRLFIQTLLSEAGLATEVQSESFFARWYSLESPLDPLLRDKYANLYDKKLFRESKQRQLQSCRTLVFDGVNAALVEIRSHGLVGISRAKSCSESPQRFTEVTSATLVEYLWAQMKEWFDSDMRWTCGDSNRLVVERVRSEVVGKGWVDKRRVELDNIGKEVEGKLLEELVEETLVDLTGRV